MNEYDVRITMIVNKQMEVVEKVVDAEESRAAYLTASKWIDPTATLSRIAVKKR